MQRTLQQEQRAWTRNSAIWLLVPGQGLNHSYAQASGEHHAGVAGRQHNYFLQEAYAESKAKLAELHACWNTQLSEQMPLWHNDRAASHLHCRCQP
jgi:hypothetical protein